MGGATSRTLLVVDDPDAVFRHAVAAGATPTTPPANEHGWRLPGITDPFGHQRGTGAHSAPGRQVDRSAIAGTGSHSPSAQNISFGYDTNGPVLWRDSRQIGGSALASPETHHTP